MGNAPKAGDSVINTEIALQRLNGNRSLLSALAGFFLEDAPQLVCQLQAGIEAGSVEQTVRSAHSLRGLASSFEAIPVMKLTSEIERLGRSGDFSRLKDLINDLDAEMSRLTVELQRIAADGGRK